MTDPCRLVELDGKFLIYDSRYPDELPYEASTREYAEQMLRDFNTISNAGHFEKASE
jgi:hypothetical protein